jgi:hypothetical protein
MKNFLFVPVTFALVASLVLWTNNFTDKANAQGTATTSETLSPFANLTKNWYRYTAKDGSYSALFPSQPEETIESDHNQVAYYDSVNDRSYMIVFLKFPNRNEAENFVEEDVVPLNEGDVIVTDRKKISLNGLSGREITFQTKDDWVWKMQVAVDSKLPSIYMAIVVAKKGNKDFPEAQAFLDSMSIKQR